MRFERSFHVACLQIPNLKATAGIKATKQPAFMV